MLPDPSPNAPRNRFSCTLADGGDPDDAPSPIFMIQKQTSHVHRWHLRVEVGDRLKSWIVPRGLHTEPSERRIAIPTADAPVRDTSADPAAPKRDPDGARIWDSGPYTNLRVGADGRAIPLEDQLQAGHAILWLHGERIQGGYALIRAEAGRTGRWLLVRLQEDG